MLVTLSGMSMLSNEMHPVNLQLAVYQYVLIKTVEK